MEGETFLVGEVASDKHFIDVLYGLVCVFLNNKFNYIILYYIVKKYWRPFRMGCEHEARRWAMLPL